MKKIAKYMFIVIAIVYVVLYIIEQINLSHASSYGEDPTGFGVLILPFIAFFSALGALLILGIVWVVSRIAKKEYFAGRRLALFLLSFSILSLPGLLLVGFFGLISLVMGGSGG